MGNGHGKPLHGTIELEILFGISPSKDKRQTEGKRHPDEMCSNLTATERVNTEMAVNENGKLAGQQKP